ncbi:MAG: DUF2341 domain-containing protein, partial [Bacteroidales bacterium]|nr:DUF2341 domain-containing protein [Bacteroidales bacterium]
MIVHKIMYFIVSDIIKLLNLRAFNGRETTANQYLTDRQFGSTIPLGTFMRTLFRHNSQRFGKGRGAFAVQIILLGLWSISFMRAQTIPFSSLGYGYEKTITIDPARVAGLADLTDFPLLVRISGDVNLSNPGSGGHVFSANGYDLAFVDQNGYALDFEIELYNGTTGTLVAWVRIPTLSTSANTVIKLLYGNPQITADPSTTNVWNSDYGGVWHFSNNSFLDATSNNNDGSNSGSTGGTWTLGGYRSFDGIDDKISIPSNPSLEPTAEITVSAWIRRSGTQVTWAKPLWYGTNAVDPWGPYGFEFYDMEDDRLGFHTSIGGVEIEPLSGSEINSGVFYLLTGTFDGTNTRLYINGVLRNTVAQAGIIDDYIGIDFAIGGKTENNTQNFKGMVDEVRVLNKARSADWIATEYNNQGSPGTFFSVTGETVHSVYNFGDAGFNNICPNSTIPYSVPNNGFIYSWGVTGNGSIQSGAGTNAITVLWTTSTGGETISLNVDDGSNSDLATYNVFIGDNTNPTVTSCPAAINVNSDAGVCTATLDPDNPVFADNCAVTKVTWTMTGATTA